MTRWMSIAFEDPQDCRFSGPSRAAALARPIRRPGDPGQDTLEAPLEDPGGDTLEAPLEDPGGDALEPPLEDPRGGGLWAAGGSPRAGSGCRQPLVLHCGCGCGCGGEHAQGGSSPAPEIRPGELSGFVVLRLAAGLLPRADETSLEELAETHHLDGLRDVLRWAAGRREEETAAPETARAASEPTGTCLRSRPLIDLADRRGFGRQSEMAAVLLALETRAASTSFPPLHSLASYWRLDARCLGSRIHELVDRLGALPEVSLTYAEKLAEDSGETSTAAPLFAAMQGFLDDAPVGIAGRWARQQLSAQPPTTAADETRLVDLEQGWILDHVELQPQVGPLQIGDNRHGEGEYVGHHGTAVLGQMLSSGSGDPHDGGVLTHAGKVHLASHYLGQDAAFPRTNGHVAQAVVEVLLKLYPELMPGHGGEIHEIRYGHVLLLEVQRGRRPEETDRASFEAIRLASALGLTVVEAAGNGGFDLDTWSDAEGRRRLDRRSGEFLDSGAILVGAARAGVPHERASFSNYGSRLDCYAWGEAVTTCGYGDLDNGGGDLTHTYTNTFNGTSSAAPVIAVAAVLVQRIYRQATGVALSPMRLRRLLADRATGTPQGQRVPGDIAVMPNLKRLLGERLRLAPALYLRRFVGDDGSRSCPGPVSSCPDIVVSDEPIHGFLQALGEGSGSENAEAPGTAVAPGQEHHLHVRVRNRGRRAAEHPRVRLYAAPAATLLTPGLWQEVPVGLSTPSHFPKGAPGGDLLAVSREVVWTPDSNWKEAGHRAAFLALVSSDEEAPPLPPGAPYFDWAVFRRFQRRHSTVACRNVHRVAVGGAGPVELPFLLTGTPDRARQFELEILQRLPAAAQVRWSGPKWLKAQLHQRQPWIEVTVPDDPKGLTLHLPPEPRLAFRRIRLEAGACHPVSFTVASGGLQTGHSLAIRQLWQGEEVGRITWWFERVGGSEEEKGTHNDGRRIDL